VQHVDGKVLETLRTTVIDVSEPHPDLFRVLMVPDPADCPPGADVTSLPEKVGYVTGLPPCVGQTVVLRRVRVARPLGSRHVLEVVEKDGSRRQLGLLGYCVSANDAPF